MTNGPIEWSPRSPNLTPPDFSMGLYKIKALCRQIAKFTGVA